MADPRDHCRRVSFSAPDEVARAVAKVTRWADGAGGIDRNHPLPMGLSCAVPLWAHRLCEDPRGLAGIFDKTELEALAERLWVAGEALLHRIPGKTADGFNALAEIIARLAFCPGGVRCFGMRFEYEPGRWRDGKHGVPE